MYVEPTAMAAIGNEALLAGTPTFIWTRTAGSGITRAPSPRVLGAIISANGSARIVPSPIVAEHVSGIRALGREDGTWALVFAELVPPADPTSTPTDLASRLWFGIYDGTSWTRLEEIPRPAGTQLHPVLSSTLAHHGGRFAWAMMNTTANHHTDVIVFERVNGRWSHEVVTTQDAGYVDLTYSGAHGLLLATTRADPSSPRDGRSLVIYARKPQWQLTQTLLPRGPASIHWPRFIPGAGVSLRWWSEVQDSTGMHHAARALVGPGVQDVVTVDSSVAEGFTHLNTQHGRHLWLTDHVSPGSQQRTLRFSIGTTRTATPVGQIPNPFTGNFDATMQGRSHILVAGPLVDRAAGTVVTLLIRARSNC